MLAILVDRVIVGDGITVLGPSTVWIKDGMIERLTTGRAQVFPPHTQVHSFPSGSTLLPGFIDTHVHLSIESGEYQLDLLRKTREDRALLALWAARKLLQEGFTTLRSAGDADSAGVASFAVQRAAERGLFLSPRIVGAPHYISITGGGGDLSFQGCPHLPVRDGLVADGVEGMQLAVRQELKMGADWIKILVTGAFMASSPGDSPENSHFSQEELHAVVQEATRRNVPVMAHAHGARGITESAKAGVRSIEVATS